MSGNNYLRFLVFYAFIIFMNYFMPGIIRILFFTSLLFFFYRSKDDPFWIALFFLILYAPAYMFNQIDSLYNLNFYRVPGSDRNISFNELVTIVIFFKALSQNNKFIINRIFLMLILYSIFLFLISFAFGISPTKFLRTIRFLIPFTLFWSIPALLITKEKFLEIFNYFLVFSIIVFILQIYQFVTGEHFFLLLGGQFLQRFEDASEIILDSEKDLLRPLYSTHILFLNIIAGLYYFITGSEKKPRFLYIYITLSLVGLIITGTRGYAIGSVIMIILFALFIPMKIRVLTRYIILAMIGLLFIFMIPSVNSQMKMALNRIFTVRLLMEGDITAGGTAQRFDRYMPMVMEKFAESPVIGFGFSNQFYANTNAHVAIPNTLLNGGIIGLIVFLVCIGYFYYRSFYFFNHLHSVYIIIFIGLTGFMIVHSFSFAVFSFLLGQANYSCFILFLSFSDVLLRDNEFRIKTRKIQNLQSVSRLTGVV